MSAGAFSPVAGRGSGSIGVGGPGLGGGEMARELLVHGCTGSGWSGQRMKKRAALFIFCWVIQLEDAAAARIEDHSVYEACVQNGCSSLCSWLFALRHCSSGRTVRTIMCLLVERWELDDNSLTGTVPTQMGRSAHGFMNYHRLVLEHSPLCNGNPNNPNLGQSDPKYLYQNIFHISQSL
ncbi:hypothetical protein CYMTET_56664 [Cymbomonas tetramitiformis]|uniref:Uncharacterized protein n=1 Tax=Cymbomonas tetramitiformis TaxID=36881 RepID=A0AAE0ENJ2_9CHLO|nr:hypothetical protein CYMTET_56664 [Cymbomonas tetramitiformis]